jgi:nucleotide-binding universal stress UspA family protein
MLSNIKSVLVGVTEESGEREVSSALCYGLGLSRAAGAHLTVQAASLKLVLTQAFVSDFAAGLVTAENQRLNALAEAAAERARRDAASEGVACMVESPQLRYPELLEAFTAQSREHDLAVLDAEPVSLTVDRGLIEQVVFESGRPLVVVPNEWDTFTCERIVIAWDGSAQAARAMNDALPFLRAAKEVAIAAVLAEDGTSVAGAEVAPHLARHGIDVTVANLDPKSGGIAQTLRDYATYFRADMLVAGAFGQSRLREFVFGSVTQSLLKECKVPLLLSH